MRSNVRPPLRPRAAAIVAAVFAMPFLISAGGDGDDHAPPGATTAPSRKTCRCAERPRETFARTIENYAPPGVVLVDRRGRPAPLARELKRGKVVVLQFMFTTCSTVCPVATGALETARRELGADIDKVHLVSISIDPEQDTPERLRAFAREFSAGPEWSFLTGRAQDVVAVQKAFDAYPGNKSRHERLTFLRRTAGGPWVRLNGPCSGKALAAEARRLLREGRP